MSWSVAFGLGVLRGMGWALVVGVLWWLSWHVGRALERRLAGWLLHRTTRLPPPGRDVTNLAGRVSRESAEKLRRRIETINPANGVHRGS